MTRKFTLTTSVALVATAFGSVHAATSLSSCPAATVSIAVSASGKSDSTDYTTLNQAINKLSSYAGTKLIKLNNGTYRLNQTLRLPSNFTICAPSGATFTPNMPVNPVAQIEIKDGVTNSGLYNLTFERLGISIGNEGVSGMSTARTISVVSNTFKNITAPTGAETFGYTGILIAHATDINITRNEFSAISGQGIWGNKVSKLNVSSNVFSALNQPIHTRCLDNSTIDANRFTKIGRFAIETQIHDNSANSLSYQRCDAGQPSIQITNNYMADWTSPDVTGLEIMGISTELVGGSITGNTLFCGTDCKSAWTTSSLQQAFFGAPNLHGITGIEISGQDTDKLTVSGNVIDGFSTGMSIAHGSAVDINGNYIANANFGLGPTSVASVTGSLNMSGNHLVNMRHRGFSGTWGVVRNLTIAKNFIYRQAGAFSTDKTQRTDWPGDGAYAAIAISPTALNASSESISSNTIVTIGDGLSNFESRGILFTGTANNISVTDNWIGWQGSDTQKFASGFMANSGPASIAGGENISGNVLQHVTTAFAGFDNNGVCAFSAFPLNTLVNMTSVGGCTNVVANAPLNVVLSTITPKAVKQLFPEKNMLSTYKFSVSGSGFASNSAITWAFGNGPLKASTTSTVETVSYPFSGSRTANVVYRGPQKEGVISTLSVTP